MPNCKKLVLQIFLFICICTPIHAQFEKGDVLIGLSTRMSSLGTGPEMFGVGYWKSTTHYQGTKKTNDESLGINLIPKLGYFMMKNFAMGIDIGLLYRTIDHDNLFYGGLSLFGRYYLFKSKLFIEANGGYSAGKVNEEKSEFANFGGNLGLSIPLYEKLFVDMVLGYDYIREMPLIKPPDVISVMNSIGFELGFTYIIRNEE